MTAAKKKTTKKTAKKAPTKSGTTPAKQTAIPGTKPKRDKKLEALAEDYEEKRDERMAWGKKEIAAKTALINHLEAKGITTYNDGELEVTVTTKDPTPKLKVKRTESHAEAAE